MSAHPHHWEGTSIWPLLWVEVKYCAFPLCGTARYGSVQFTFGGFSTGYSTWYMVLFLLPPRPRFQAIRTVTKTWRENSSDHWLAGENLYYGAFPLHGTARYGTVSLLCHWTCDTRPNIDPLDLNQHSQRRIGRNFCLNKCTFCINHKMVVSLSVVEVQMFLSLIAEERI